MSNQASQFDQYLVNTIYPILIQVRTAPTPSQPPTPFAEGGKPLPGELGRETREDKQQHPEEKISVTEGQLCEDTEEKLKVTEKDEDPRSPREREDKMTTEEAQGPVPDLVPQGEQQPENGGETDSLKVSFVRHIKLVICKFHRTLTLWPSPSRNAKRGRQHLTPWIHHPPCRIAGHQHHLYLLLLCRQ